MTAPAGLGLVDRDLRIARVEGITVPPGGSMDLACLTGSGTVVEVFLAVGSNGGHAPYDSILTVTSDGRTSPDWTSDLGTLFASHFGQNLDGQWSCDRAHVEINSGGGYAVGYVLTLPMPYRDGMDVVFSNPTADVVTLWTQVVYSPGEPAAQRLRGEGRTWANKLGIPAVWPARLATVDTGSGWLVWLSIVGMANSGDGNSALGWLERNIEYTTDGADSPQFASTGLEDMFGGSFYFQGRQGYGAPWAMVGAVDTSRRVAAMALDALSLYGGMRYRAGMRLDIAPQPGAPDHHQSWLVLWYEDVPPTP